MGSLLKTKTIVVDIRSHTDKERVIKALEDMQIPPISIAITCGTKDESYPGHSVPNLETCADKLQNMLEKLLKREVVCYE